MNGRRRPAAPPAFTEDDIKGFFNRILKVDVGEQSFSIQELSDQELEMGLGGKGLATRLLLNENPPGVDPLSPDNHLIIAVGPVTDSPIHGSCRHGIFTKSPQTGFYSESYSGGKAAESISRTGYDAVSDRGACHLRATFYKPELSGMIDPDRIEGKAELFVDFEDRLTLFDTMIFCRFYRDLYSWPELSRIIHITTGLTWGKEEIRTMTQRVVSLCRAFNLREGMTRKDDCLPPRFHKEALPESGKVITENELNRLMKDYYRLRGWE